MDAQKVMKTILIAAAVALGLFNALAQNDIPLDGKTATFTDRQGRVYDRAALVRADLTRLIFKTNGDFGTVALTNLSPATMQTLGIPTNQVQKAQELERQRKEAALKQQAATAEEQQLLLDPTNLVLIKVDVVAGKVGYSPIYGDIYKCSMRKAQGAAFTACVAKLSPDMATYPGRVAAMEQAVAQLTALLENQSAQLAQRQRQVEIADAVTPGLDAEYYYYYGPAMTQRRLINLAYLDLKDANAALEEGRRNLEELRGQLTAVKNGEAAATTKLMLPSRRTFNGMPLYICAPESVQQTAVAADQKTR